ncbi:bifunctional GNAT family N-acetyltransferase/carbon-nitrogen hydrolase family protein [uncultured Cohaesibacter sp.]|uniref:bifunctional GNAT family N-acetyltransferase/carbon-nitrogen hydrolase family protein n=1 Tax=uncultured Cohaesibacter sp. TaxID=1002546 RepID=UPI0029C667AC|nr:bifunctional GNAT family N-acetyltransferase/carbon-nitrogen hydrolase family protein [uncultured Cohaesibacter sp.]
MNSKNIDVIVRQATYEDIPAITRLSEKIYGDHAVQEEMLGGQMSAFPEGQFVTTYNGEVVGHCATFIISGDIALKPHNWTSITGHGYASRHDPDGDYLYGMEVVVDERFRGLRIGQRLYDGRKHLCEKLELKGIIFGGRMPNLHKKLKQYGTPEDYLEQVINGKQNDPVISFQIRNGFTVLGLLKGYLPFDKESLGYATHMVWYNPKIDRDQPKPLSKRGLSRDSVRVASVQYQARKVKSFEDFAAQLEYFVDVATVYRSDFVVFPEMLTIPLLSIESKKLTPQQSIEKISTYTEKFVTFMQNLAISYNINIIGGTHPTVMKDGSLENLAYVFLRTGAVHTQSKIHPTPNERYWWNIEGGDKLKPIQTDCGPIGVLICYDSEFPELARHLTDQGMKILFVPFCTDERQGYLRVRYCCQARAIENQIYVVTSGIVGNLPDVENMDVHYAESGIFTPCDFPFARDGIAALADTNTETIIFSDLKTDQLTISRNSGTVQNLKDRRFDLYRVEWNPKSSPQQEPAIKIR